MVDDLDPDSLGYALRELTKLEAFTYVPPFRGRAIRMIHRDAAFEKLEIDFDALERRKALEYEKLNNVIRFALSGTCRQREILRYFGEQNAATCGHCDNCGRHAPKVALVGERRQESPSRSSGMRAGARPSSDDREIDGELFKAVQIVLSGVARTQARFPCGKNLIAQMLCGSTNARVSKLRLDKLSTHGLLKHLTQPDVLMMIDALMALGCLEQVDLEKFRPVIQITEFGTDVMKGKTPLMGPLPLPEDLLRKLRGKQANRTREPRGDPALAETPSRVYRHTDSEAIGATHDATSEAVGGEAPPSSPLSVHPSHYWTRRLLSAGFTIDECMVIRGLSRETILEQARHADHEA